MILLTGTHRAQLLANSRQSDVDHIPVVKFFNPLGEGVWLATELDTDGDTMFGLADIDYPELGSWSFPRSGCLSAWGSSGICTSPGISRSRSGPMRHDGRAVFVMRNGCFTRERIVMPCRAKSLPVQAIGALDPGCPILRSGAALSELEGGALPCGGFPAEREAPGVRHGDEADGQWHF